MREKPVIAIDGPSGVGKTTVAKRVAAALDFVLVDTGALYRTVALMADRVGVAWESADALAALAAAHRFDYKKDGLYLDGAKIGDEIRTPRISMGASAVAMHPEVRETLLDIQRDIGKKGGVVLEGRDVGTAVFPDAEVKIFLTASANERARRRFLELAERGDLLTFEEVLEEQERRDAADRNRDAAPLREAPDAVLIECDDMTADQVVSAILDEIHVSFPLTSI
jgi:CMP/dCMP kinase